MIFSVQGLGQKKITVDKMSPVEYNIDFLKSYLVTAVTKHSIFLLQPRNVFAQCNLCNVLWTQSSETLNVVDLFYNENDIFHKNGRSNFLAGAPGLAEAQFRINASLQEPGISH